MHLIAPDQAAASSRAGRPTRTADALHMRMITAIATVIGPFYFF